MHKVTNMLMVFELLYQLKKLSRKAVTELLIRTLQRVIPVLL